MHGLGASPFDMRHIRAAILASVPNSVVYLVQNNTGLTQDSIKTQGKRLALEIATLLKMHSVSGRLMSDFAGYAFVGHSLGGLVIREGVRRLRFLHHRLVVYVSLNTPHLGCVSSRLLVTTGRPD